MSQTRQVRATCQECHTRGQFRPIEVMLHKQGVWQWRVRILCALCRYQLEQLVGAR